MKIIAQRINTAQRLMLLRFLYSSSEAQGHRRRKQHRPDRQEEVSVKKECSMPRAVLMALASIGVPESAPAALAPNRPKIREIDELAQPTFGILLPDHAGTGRAESADRFLSCSSRHSRLERRGSNKSPTPAGPSERSGMRPPNGLLRCFWVRRRMGGMCSKSATPWTPMPAGRCRCLSRKT